jgi:hypothetical protein
MQKDYNYEPAPTYKKSLYELSVLLYPLTIRHKNVIRKVLDEI